MSRAPDDIRAEVEVTEDLVRALLVAQAPRYAALPLTPLGQGWDNEMFRLGQALAVRAPRRAAGAALLGHEIRWLPILGPHLPAPVPTPVFAGEPQGAYPFPWSIVPFVPGHKLGDTVGIGPRFARELGGFLAALHSLALPKDPPHNPYRTALREPSRGEAVARHLSALGAERDVSGLQALWRAACAAELAAQPVWCHGDLHPFNLIARDAGLAGVIDWGDMTAGDPAVDLAIAWVALTGAEREAFLEAYGPVRAPTRARARGWALVFGLMFWDSARRGASASFGRVGERALAGLGQETV